MMVELLFFFFSSRRRHTRWNCDWSSDVCSSDLPRERFVPAERAHAAYVDEDIPLAAGRYLMEPMIFARLVQEAEASPSDNALLVGSATGYGAAVMAPLVRSVVALESDPALAAKGREQFARLAVIGATQAEGPL